MKEVFIKAGKRIEFIREFRKLTREEFAGELGVDTDTISGIEAEGKGFTGTMLNDICNILKIDPNYIVDGKINRIYDAELEMAIKSYSLENK